MEARLVEYRRGSPYWRPLEEFTESQGLTIESLGHRIQALEAPNARYVEVYSPTIRIAELASRSRGFLYTMGLYLGMMRPRAWFKPSLPLAKSLAPKCGHAVDCIVVEEQGERFFLYGKRVYEANIRRWRRGLSLVINYRGEALGWGIGRIVKIGGGEQRCVEPVWDMGWYLRRGG